jgi:hypothetical protein
MDWSLLARKAAEPITSYPETYSQMNRDAREQIEQGIEQLRQAYQAGVHDPVGYVKGLGNVGFGTAGYLGSPISAALRTTAGRPIEELTGIPKEYTEFGLGLTLGSPWLRPNVAAPIRSSAAFRLHPDVAFDNARALTALEEVQRLRYNQARDLLEELDPRNPQLSALDTSKWSPQRWDVDRLNQEIANMKRLADRQKKGEVDLYDSETVQRLKALDEHHPFPRKFSREFRDAGIEPNDYTMPIDVGRHRWLHTNPNRWEKVWSDYLEAVPERSPADLIEQLNEMNKRYFRVSR